MSKLSFVDAVTLKHFTAMSLIHALGWRTTYVDAVPADFMAEHITDDHWISLFRKDYETSRCHGLLLYDAGVPVACANYGPARIGTSTQGGAACEFKAEDYTGWGEIISFYTHPDHKGKGYGGALMEEVLRRLKADGFTQCYVLVLRENMGARRFYERHGFAWDGTREDIPFPHDTICVDLRYVRRLDFLGSD
jgi:ribosomal protein S18 acetylase RimI-like enzyme